MKFFNIKRALIVTIIFASAILQSTVALAIDFAYFPNNNENSLTLAITGDSFAGYFVNYEKERDFNFKVFAYPGRTTIDNYELMYNAANADADYIIVSIGVNDHVHSTDPEDFKERINSIVLNAKSCNKKVFLHTYMPYFFYQIMGYTIKYDVKDYDIKLREIANRHDNVIYIDMNDCAIPDFMQVDMVHYNQGFYDVLYGRIVSEIVRISNEEA